MIVFLLVSQFSKEIQLNGKRQEKRVDRQGGYQTLNRNFLTKSPKQTMLVEPKWWRILISATQSILSKQTGSGNLKHKKWGEGER